MKLVAAEFVTLDGVYQGPGGPGEDTRGGFDRARLVSDEIWTIVYSRQAQKDAKNLASSGLKKKAQSLLEILAADPFANPPRYEKLVGDLAGCYSRRINIQHRLVYEVFPEEQTVHVLRMWTHYE